MLMTLGWVSAAMMRASTWNLASNCGSASRAGRSSLTATSRPRVTSVARHTSPMPPVATRASRRYRPSSTSPERGTAYLHPSAAGRAPPGCRLLRRLRHIAFDLRVDTDIVERAGHDRDDGVAGLGAVAAGTTEVAALGRGDHSDDQPDDDDDRTDAHWYLLRDWVAGRDCRVRTGYSAAGCRPVGGYGEVGCGLRPTSLR